MSRDTPLGLFPLDLSPATPTADHVSHLTSSHENPKVAGLIWMGASLVMLIPAGDRNDIIVLRQESPRQP